MTRVPPTASPVRTARRKNVSLAFTGALLVILLATGVAQAAAVTVGFRDFAYDPGQASRATADTQQSKLWFAGAPLVRRLLQLRRQLVQHLPPRPGDPHLGRSHIHVDTRDRTHADYLFDAATNKLCVVSTKSPCTSTTNDCNDGVRVSRYSYVAANPLGDPLHARLDVDDLRRRL